MNKNTSSTTVSSYTTHKACIEAVIKKDSTLGTIRNHGCEKASLSHTIKEYAKGIDAINFEKCPVEFRQAFNVHKSAWLDMVAVTDHYPEMRGEMHDLFDQIEKGQHAEAFKERLKSIWNTWAEIENVMKKYEE